MLHIEYTSIYRLSSLSISHFIFLTWYQSHCSGFLVPMVISGVLLLPSLSSSSHCQKQVIAIKPQLLQPSNPIYSLINSSNHDHEFIDRLSQTKPNRKHPEPCLHMPPRPVEAFYESNMHLTYHHAPPDLPMCQHTLDPRAPGVPRASHSLRVATSALR